jgi:hypothetical protein
MSRFSDLPESSYCSGDDVPRFIPTRYEDNSSHATVPVRFGAENRTEECEGLVSGLAYCLCFPYRNYSTYA